MNIFQTQSGIIDDYATYIRSFLNIADPTIREVVEGELRGYPETLSSCHTEITQHPCGNETPGDHIEGACAAYDEYC